MITIEENRFKWGCAPAKYMEKAGFSPKGCAFFHMQTTGRFWRNSSITSLELLFPQKQDFRQLSFRLPPDSDEYDILKAFGEAMAPLTHLIGYNSTSFHVPYLEKKYRAYGLCSPFNGKRHTDLYRELRSTGKALSLSMKLEDLKDFLRLDSPGELPWIAGLLELYTYRDFLNGDFTVSGAKPLSEDEFLVFLTPRSPFLVPFRIHHDSFYLVGEDGGAKIKIKVFENRIRVYYPDVEDYYYLPKEDSVLHKSMAAYVNKEHRIKADYSNCYTYTPYDDSFLQDIARLQKYVASLLQYYFSCS